MCNKNHSWYECGECSNTWLDMFPEDWIVFVEQMVETPEDLRDKIMKDLFAEAKKNRTDLQK